MTADVLLGGVFVVAAALVCLMAVLVVQMTGVRRELTSIRREGIARDAFHTHDIRELRDSHAALDRRVAAIEIAGAL